MSAARVLLLPLLLALTVSWAAPARADITRFDVQTFRPTPGPRDLVIVPQSQPISHLSFSVGTFLHFMLDPLALVSLSGERIDVIKNRLQLDLMAAAGLWDWFELGVVVPIVLFQAGGNLEVIGSEGAVRSSGFSDISLFGKVPLVKRLPYASGLGAAMSLRVNVPLPGAQEAFAGDGAVTYNPTVIVDYRFDTAAALIAGQVGAHFRPEGEFFDAAIGPTITANLGAEALIVRRWGLGALGGVYANFPLTKLADSAYRPAAEGLLGLRWYADFGVVFTAGLNFGGACNFGVPTFGFFISAVWVPLKTREHEAILHFKKPPDDPDGDGLIGEHDRCPNLKGPVENHGCPIRDMDKDGIPDHLDKCPTLPGRYDGCPRVYAHRNKIKVLEKVHFATDQDVILPESFSVLEEVAELIAAHPEWLEILVEGHADFRASDAYNLDLSQRRAGSVMRFLTTRGVEPSRLRAQGFGRSRPVADNRTEEGMALNRRVEFTLLRVSPSSSLPQTPVGPAGPRPAAPGGK